MVKHGDSDRNQDCEYMDMRRDCDGDWDRYCHTSKYCPYKNVRDCDGDFISLCRK